MDDEMYHKAAIFSGIDFLMELITFWAMMLIFHLHLKIEALRVGATYVKDKKLLLPLLSVCIMVIIASGAFFSKHNGVDPTFQFDEFNTR